MTESREFHISSVISAATGIHVALDGVGAFYELLGFMTGSTPMTHQLPRLSRECEPSLRAQHPDLTSEPIPEIASFDDVNAWMATLYPKYGEKVSVAALDRQDHTDIDPISELKMMRPDMPIIAISTDTDGGAA
jgi:hypothetical protein